MYLSVVGDTSSSGYTPASVEARQSESGAMGLFARQPIHTGELVAVFGGTVVTGVQLQGFAPKTYSLQIEEDLFLVSDRPGPSDYVNHCCRPNSGLRGQVILVAMRPILVDEEITYDYATSDGSSYDEFECACGAPGCRGRVSGNDWQKPKLWRRYAGYFSPYIQARIDALQSQKATRFG